MKQRNFGTLLKVQINATNKLQKETMFIQMLEGLHKDEAKVLLVYEK
jgi:hypothetical protein